MSSATVGVAVAVSAIGRLGADGAGGVGEGEVVGTEVVAPLRDAVRLVDDEQADVGLRDCAQEARRGEALGRDVEHPAVAAHAREHGLDVERPGALRVDQLHRSRRELAQRLDLIVHQRDQRGDDEREVVADQRRQLVAQ